MFLLHIGMQAPVMNLLSVDFDLWKSFHSWIWLHIVQGGQLGGTYPLSCPYRGRGSWPVLFRFTLKSFQVCGSAGGHCGARPLACCSIRSGSELTNESWPPCVLDLLAEVTEVLPWVPAGDCAPSVWLADGCGAITMRPPDAFCHLRENEPAKKAGRQTGGYQGS